MSYDEWMEQIALDKAKEIAINLYKTGKDISFISEVTNVSEDIVKTWFSENGAV